MTDHTTEHSPSRATRSSRHSRSGRGLLAFEMPRLSLGRPKWPMLAAAGVLIVLASCIVGDLAVSWGRVHPGVRIDGVDVGGLGVSGARAAIEHDLGPRVQLPVTVAHESRRWTVTPARVGARLDSEKAAEQAYAVGRSGGVFAEIGDRAGAWFGRRMLVVPAAFDAGRLDTVVADIRHTVDLPAQDASVTVSGTSVTRSPAKAGLVVQEPAFRAALLTAFVSQQRIVRLTTVYAPVSITDADADQAYQDAQRMVSGDVELAYSGKTWKVSAERIGGWLRFRGMPWSTDTSGVLSAVASASVQPSSTVSTPTPGAVGRRMMLVAYVDPAQVSATLDPLVKNVGKPARDAKFVVNGSKITIQPSQVGVGIDVAGLTDKLNHVLRTDVSRTVTMTLTSTEPTLTTAQAKGMGIKQLISSYSTDYDPSNAPRVNNIHTLARALDGKLVPPGGEFSFNDAVGERTAAKGYQEAPAIVNGKLVPQLGGGICQTATTFFNAVFFSGFTVLERTNHSFYISHYPKGRDCTVSWGGPDFRWRNDSSSWVLVHTDYDSGSITFSLYGTDPGYKVDYTTGPFTNVVPYSTLHENDPTLKAGQTVVADSGVDGRKVVVVRTVTLDGKVVRKDTFTSAYQPKDETVKVGTMPASVATTATTPTPTPKR